jgi:HEPN domain-containing protein
MPPSKSLINEWIEKAEGDHEVALREYKSKKKKRIYYIIAFHCQQTIEKLLKALLLCHKIEFPKTHDLLRLLHLLKTKDAFLSAIELELSDLSPYAIDFRYPGDDIELSELKQVIAKTTKLRKILLNRLKEFVQIKSA